MLQDRHGAGNSDKIIKESRLDSTLFLLSMLGKPYSNKIFTNITAITT